MATGYTLSSAEDIIQIGQSITDDVFENYFCGHCPGFDVAWDVDGVGTSTYHIAAFDNALQKGGGFQWKPGGERPGRAKLDKLDVTVTPESYSTLTLGAATGRTRAHTFADLDGNILPILFSKMFQIADKKLVSFLTNASNFGQANFTGTDILDDFAADQEPMWNFLNLMIAPLRKYARARPKAVIEMWVEDHVLDVLASHWNFQGAGVVVVATTPDKVLGVGPGTQRREALIAKLEGNLGLKVVSKSATGDTAALGITSSPQELAYGLCWIGIVDHSTDGTDLSAGGPLKPDGAIQMGWGSRPNIENWIAPGSKMEDFAGDLAFDVVSPRGSAWGFLLPVAQIITP